MGLLSRAQRASGIHAAPGEAATIPLFTSNSNNTLWASSLIHWLAIAGLSLSSGGTSTQNTGAERLDNYCARHGTLIAAQDIQALNNIGLRTVSDASRPTLNPTIHEWARGASLPGIDSLPPRFDLHPPPYTTPHLKPQQCWCLHPYTEVIEPLGWVSSPSLTAQPTEISIRRWVLPPGTIGTSQREGLRGTTPTAHRVGTTLHLSADTHSTGAGTQLHVAYTTLFPPVTPTSHPIYQVVLSPDQNRARRQGVQRTVLLSRLSAVPSPFPPPRNLPPPTRSTPLRHNIQQYASTLRNSTIYTDASFTTDSHPIDRFFNSGPPPTVTATASIIFQPTGVQHLSSNTLAIRIIDGHVIPDVNPFIMETLGLALASKLRHSIDPQHRHDPLVMPMHSDCKGAISLATGEVKQPWKKSVFYLLRAINRDAPKDSLHWIRSHAERRTKNPSFFFLLSKPF